MSEQDPLHRELESMIGQSVSTPTPGADPVNMPMIRQWTDAFNDRNPIYEDAEAAAQTRHGDIIAPPAMMQAWTMPRPKLDNLAERGGLTVDMDADSPLVKLDRAGYYGSLATNSEFEFIRPLRLGDLITSDAVLESVSPRKKTGLGLGYFVTWLTSYTDQNQELVGTQRFTILKFDPSTFAQTDAGA